MDFYINIEYKGSQKQVRIEPSEYQGQTVYQVTLGKQTAVIYHNNGQWALDKDHQMESNLLQSIGRAIEEYEQKEA